jgi:hypothetical protein
MADLNIEKYGHMRVRVTDLDDGGHIETQTVEANLLYAILEKLEKLEEIRCQGIEIEIP